MLSAPFALRRSDRGARSQVAAAEEWTGTLAAKKLEWRAAGGAGWCGAARPASDATQRGTASMTRRCSARHRTPASCVRRCKCAVAIETHASWWRCSRAEAQYAQTRWQQVQPLQRRRASSPLPRHFCARTLLPPPLQPQLPPPLQPSRCLHRPATGQEGRENGRICPHRLRAARAALKRNRRGPVRGSHSGCWSCRRAWRLIRWRRCSSWSVTTPRGLCLTPGGSA